MLKTLYEKSHNGAEEVNLTGYKWKTKNGIEFEVLKHESGKFVVKMLNRKAISRQTLFPGLKFSILKTGRGNFLC